MVFAAFDVLAGTCMSGFCDMHLREYVQLLMQRNVATKPEEPRDFIHPPSTNSHTLLLFCTTAQVSMTCIAPLDELANP
jgi:hypothetical protein